MMDGNELLSRLTKLRDLTCSKDIHSLTSAMFPGTHCPLMGAAMAVRGIKDALFLTVGTDECAYYTKDMMLGSEDFADRCLSAVVDSRDVTFGCKSMLDGAVEEMMNEYHPKAVFIVTTCVIEITGDDIDSMADSYTKKYKIPFLPVHTEHFKCENHIPGLERTLTCCIDLMKECKKDGSVNLLGQRGASFETTELSRILSQSGIKTGLQLPCGCTVEEIQNAPKARVNIVVNPIALPLAKKMEERFNTPYVLFDKFTSPDRIMGAYRNLYEKLGLELPSDVTKLYEKSKAKVEEIKPKVKGVTYIYGNTPFDCLEFNNFMVNLNMVPQIIQTSSIEPERDKEYLADIVEKSNPYVTKAANVSPLQFIYDVLHPNLYLGHEFPLRLRQKGIAMVQTDKAGSLLGFEIADYIADELVRASDEARMLKKMKEAK